MTIGILLSGCGVYDGAEIQESILTMTAIAEQGHTYQCISINKNQHHVINHLTGEEMKESRNMMVESARIARGNVKEIAEISPANIDALVIPGGFGSAKNFSNWAFDGPNGDILPEVKLLIVNLVNAGKPITALCVSPILIAKALEKSDIHANLTLGNSKDKSPYKINEFHTGIQKIGSKFEERPLKEVLIDTKNKIITAPCYMMDATILDIKQNIDLAIKEMLKLI